MAGKTHSINSTYTDTFTPASWREIYSNCIFHIPLFEAQSTNPNLYTVILQTTRLCNPPPAISFKNWNWSDMIQLVCTRVGCLNSRNHIKKIFWWFPVSKKSQGSTSFTIFLAWVFFTIYIISYVCQVNLQEFHI